MRRIVGGLCLSALLGFAGAVSGVSAQGATDAAPRELLPGDRCGTGNDRLRQLGLRPLVPVASGQPVSFRQDPLILTSDFTGTVRLRELTVAGDVPSVRFKLAYDGSEVETWDRVATRQMNGHLVSVFEPSWPARDLDRVLRGIRWGWDRLGLYWGELLTEGVEPGAGRDIYLRMAPVSLPRVRIRRPTADLQYTSHIVNIVVPGFGDTFIDDDHGFDLAGVTAKFYQHFSDSYDSVAVVPEVTYLANYGAFHRNVQNAVRGIGLAAFDNSLAYGSQARRLRSVELFTGFAFTHHMNTSHEISHQWGAYIDWTRLNGLARAGHQPSAHDPLWAEGETMIGSLLSPYLRVRRGTAGWEIERTPPPLRFHPFSLYAMGLIPKEDVPTITLFDQQNQIDTAMPAPAAGTAVTGATRTATIFNVVGMLGERSGPVDTEWHRATVVVTKDRLLTDLEMDYWTFAARRLEDPNNAGVVGYDGAGSFEVANGKRIDLRTDIRPLSGDALVETFDVDHPRFGQRDWRDVIFDSEVPSRYRIGDRVRWSGVVTARDRSDINRILIRFWKSGGTSDDAIDVWASVSSRSTFIAETHFEPAHAGTYLMDVLLFWPGSGPQSSRAALSPITID
jgi:hypothetical protein